MKPKTRQLRKAIDPLMLSTMVDHILGPAGQHALTYLQGHSGQIMEGVGNIGQGAFDLVQNHISQYGGPGAAAGALWNAASTGAKYVEAGQESLKPKRDAILSWGEKAGGVRGRVATGVANTLLNPGTIKGATDYTSIPRTVQEFSSGFIGSLLAPHFGDDAATKIANSAGKIMGGAAKITGAAAKISLDPVSAALSYLGKPEFVGKFIGAAGSADKPKAFKKLGQDVIGYSGANLVGEGITDAASAAGLVAQKVVSADGGQDVGARFGEGIQNLFGAPANLIATAGQSGATSPSFKQEAFARLQNAAKQAGTGFGQARSAIKEAKQYRQGAVLPPPPRELRELIPTDTPSAGGPISAPKSAGIRARVGAATREGLRTVATGVVGGLPSKPVATPQIQRSYKNVDYLRLKKALQQ